MVAVEVRDQHRVRGQGCRVDGGCAADHRPDPLAKEGIGEELRSRQVELHRRMPKEADPVASDIRRSLVQSVAARYRRRVEAAAKPTLAAIWPRLARIALWIGGVAALLFLLDLVGVPVTDWISDLFDNVARSRCRP